MCLVEVKNAPKLQASCALPVMAEARIYTDTLAVRKAREGIMELLLINHPLDCPICDQGGECDLQDQAMYYGSDHGRFNEYKRATSNKNFGPLIKTIMNRCIHCTRCVRFATEIAGCPEVGTIGRGSQMEISTFNLNPMSSNNIDSLSPSLTLVEHEINTKSYPSQDQNESTETVTNQLAGVLDSELSGNLIDICPVGALTSLPYAFVARPWECKSIASIDVTDTYCSKIKLDIRGQGPGSILRILPNDGSWISDKTRFSYDGLKRQRLVTPLSKIHSSSQNESTKLSPVTWDGITDLLAKSLNPTTPTTIFVGNHVDYSSMQELAEIKKGNKNLNLIFVNPDSGRYKNTLTTLANLTAEKNSRSLTTINTLSKFSFLSKADLDEADFGLLIGTNPRLESPVLNTALQKIAKRGTIALVGSHGTKLPYPVTHLGISIKSLTGILSQLESVGLTTLTPSSPSAKSKKSAGSKSRLLESKADSSQAQVQDPGTGLSPALLKKFKQSQRKLIIVGASILYRSDSAQVLEGLTNFVTKLNSVIKPATESDGVGYHSMPISLHLLHQSVSEVNAYQSGLDVAQLNAEGVARAGHTKASKDSAQSFIYYNLPAYSLNHPVIQASLESKKSFRIYVGSHGNSLTGLCDLILPVTTYTEKEAEYLNSFGEKALSSIVTYPPGHAIADKLLLKKIKEYLV